MGLPHIQGNLECWRAEVLTAREPLVQMSKTL